MQIKETPFKYHHEKAKNIFEGKIKEISSRAMGMNLSISTFNRNSLGEYDDEKMHEFIEDALKCYNRPYEKMTAAEKEYVRTLLYVAIRTAEAGIEYLLVPETFNETTSCFSIDSDCFGQMTNLVKKSSFPGYYPSLEDEDLENRVWDYESELEIYQDFPVDYTLAITAETLYEILTDKVTRFPTPYPSIIETVLKKYESLETADTEVEKRRNDWDSFMDTYHESEDFVKHMEEWVAEINQFNDSIDDDESRNDYFSEEREIIEMDDEQKLFKVYLDDYKENKNYQKQKRKINKTFEAADKFIEMYDHLKDISTKEVAQLDVHEVVEVAFRGYLEEHNQTIYTNPDVYADALDMLCRVVDLIEKNQEV